MTANLLLHRVLASSACDPRDGVVDTALELLAPRPEHRVLELGCGTGDILARIAVRVPRGLAVGTGVSGLMVRHALRRNEALVARGRVEVHAVSGFSLAGLADASFDRVLGVHVVYLWQDPAPYLAEVRRVLRADGELVLGFRDRARSASGATAHVPWMRAVDVAAWLAGAGFRVRQEVRAGERGQPLSWLRATVAKSVSPRAVARPFLPHRFHPKEIS